MPRILAVIICTIFILFLLRLDRKQYPEASLTLWLPTIWMLINTTKPIGIWFGMGGTDMESGSPLDRNIFSIFLCLGILILFVKRFNWFEAIKKNYWVLIVVGYMLISILWSDMMYVSFKRWIKVSIAVVMVFVFATETNKIQAMNAVLRRMIYISLPCSLLLIKYYQDLGVMYHKVSGEVMWVGAALQKNGLAALCVIAIFFLCWTFNRRWRGRDKAVTWYQTYIEVFLLGLAVYLFAGPQHKLTYSATSLATLIVGLIAYICFARLKKQNITISATALTIMVLVIIFIGTISPFVGKLPVDISGSMGRSETLTGRTDIWAYLVPLAEEKLFLGHGFGGFWTDEIREKTSSHAHNGYLDLILNIGLLGHILFSIFLIQCCRKAQKMILKNFDWGCLWICLLLMATVHNIAESSLVSITGTTGAILLFMMNTDQSENLVKEKLA